MFSNRTISSFKRKLHSGKAASVLWALLKLAAGNGLELMESAHSRRNGPNPYTASPLSACLPITEV